MNGSFPKETRLDSRNLFFLSRLFVKSHFARKVGENVSQFHFTSRGNARLARRENFREISKMERSEIASSRAIFE